MEHAIVTDRVREKKAFRYFQTVKKLVVEVSRILNILPILLYTIGHFVKLVFQELECNALEGQDRGEGICVLSNCTEMITTTTTARPSRTSSTGLRGRDVNSL